MYRVELFGKLTPSHFANGESFDRAVFASLVIVLQKVAKNAWRLPVFWVVFFGLGLLFAYGMGGAIGNLIAVFFFIMSPTVANLSMMSESKQIKAAYKKLGITQKDVNAAIKRIKDKIKENPEYEFENYAEVSAEPLPDGLHWEPDARNIYEDVKKQEDASFYPPPKYNGFQWFCKVLRHYADFSGRARMREYWYFTLFNIIFYFAWVILIGIFSAFTNSNEESLKIALYGYFLMMMMPALAVSVRRLHDLGKSGWMILITLIPLVGSIWMLVLMLTEGEHGKNEYGHDPKTVHEPLGEKTKLKSAAITLTVAVSFYIFMQFFQAIAFYVEYDVPFSFINLLNIVTNIVLLVAGIFLLSEQTIHDLREKGKNALLLILVSVSISFLTTLYFLIQNFGWINIAWTINVLFCLSLGFFIASLLYMRQNRQLASMAAVCVIVIAGIQILLHVHSILNFGGGESAINFVRVFNFLLPVAYIILAATYLSGEVQPVHDSVPTTAQGNARVTVPYVGRYERKAYFTLEHKVGSRYRNAGEYQKIVADQIEIGRDPQCEVRFDENFETVSRRHAAIIKDGNNWKLAPLSQTNPTFINGKTVQSEWYLQYGDEIQCAVNGPKLVFRTGEETI